MRNRTNLSESINNESDSTHEAICNSFRCHICGKNFLREPGSCCPPVFRGIANCGPPEKAFTKWRGRIGDWDATRDQLLFDDEWLRSRFAKTSIGKFLISHELPSSHSRPYEAAIRHSGIRSGVVMDFGCCIGHGSHVLKQHAPNIQYLGVDISPAFLMIGTVLHDAEAWYLSTPAPDGSLALSNVADNSVDLLISSLLTTYLDCSLLLSEWRRVLKPGGFFHFETHTPSAIRNTAGWCSEDIYPDTQQRNAISRWFEQHFETVHLRWPIKDFIDGVQRISGTFQLRG